MWLALTQSLDLNRTHYFGGKGELDLCLTAELDVNPHLPLTHLCFWSYGLQSWTRVTPLDFLGLQFTDGIHGTSQLP